MKNTTHQISNVSSISAVLIDPTLSEPSAVWIKLVCLIPAYQILIADRQALRERQGRLCFMALTERWSSGIIKELRVTCLIQLAYRKAGIVRVDSFHKIC